jgi:hypothetical protein
VIGNGPLRARGYCQFVECRTGHIAANCPHGDYDDEDDEDYGDDGPKSY